MLALAPQKRTVAFALVLLAGSTVSGAKSLPFKPLSGPNDYFTASTLTAAYEKDMTPFLSYRAASIDMAALDRHGHFPYGDVPEDSTARRLFEQAKLRDLAEETPPEKTALVPPSPGGHTGIPSAVATTGALLGGLAILIKILTLGI